MARAIQPLRRSILSQTQSLLHQLQIPRQTQNPIIPISWTSQFLSPPARSSSTSVVSEMRKSAIENNLLRLLRNEIQYEHENNTPQQPVVELNGFKVLDRPGEQWINLEKKFEESEEIKVEVTMFDGAIPIPKEGDKPGLPGEEVQLHITMIVTIFKQDNNQVLEFICSAWPDTLEIQKLFVRDQEAVMTKTEPYTGPVFGELDEELQDSLYSFLEDRGIDDNLCISLHKYIDNKAQAETIRWMGSVKSVLEK